MDEPTEGLFEPDYKRPCDNCGELPSVVFIPYDTKESTTNVGLCGACCWGEADLIDPENW